MCALRKLTPGCKAVNEFELIERYFTRHAMSNDVVLGVGDDCAIVSPPVGRQLVMSVDTSVAGRHFPEDTPAKHIATRSLAVALSDIAAMGARAHWFMLSLTLPEADEAWLSDFSDGLLDFAAKHELNLVGGDTSRGPLSVSVSVYGSVEPGKVIRRDGARPDDIIYVTGSLGDGAAALAMLKKELTVSQAAQAHIRKRFYAPEPRLREGELLAGVASAGIDISDGLYADLSKVCSASAVGALVDVARVPTSDSWRDNVNDGKRLEWALTSGDDYELCFTVPRAQASLVETWVKEGRIGATAIGKILNEPGVVFVKEGKPYLVQQEGFDHFV